MTTLSIVCLETPAFYELVETVMERLQEQQVDKNLNKWIPKDEAMSMLNITSNSTLQKYRDEGRIRFTQPKRKLILYDRDSILEYLETNVKSTF